MVEVCIFSVSYWQKTNWNRVGYYRIIDIVTVILDTASWLPGWLGEQPNKPS